MVEFVQAVVRCCKACRTTEPGQAQFDTRATVEDQVAQAAVRLITIHGKAGRGKGLREGLQRRYSAF